ncbi:MAG: DUF393 domain-containing protein [Alphaproteobacteria bacterium]
MSEKSDAKPTTYYNGACPVCRTEIDHYRQCAVADKASMDWCDVSQSRAALKDRGIDEDEILRRLYVETTDGRLLGGVDAFLAIWRGVPRLNWIARVVSLPIIYPCACFLYDRVLAPALFHWNIRTGRVSRLTNS